jgi:hypothetical protein
VKGNGGQQTMTTANPYVLFSSGLCVYRKCGYCCGADMPLVFAGRGSSDACLSVAVGHSSARPPPWEAEPSLAARPLLEDLALLLKTPCARSLIVRVFGDM